MPAASLATYAVLPPPAVQYDQQDIMEQQLLQLEEGPEPAEQQQELEQQQEAPDTAGTPGPSSQQAMHMDITPGQSQQGMAGTPMGTPDWLQRPAATGDDDEEDRQASTSGLWGLADNVDVMACRADWLYHRCAWPSLWHCRLCCCCCRCCCCCHCGAVQRRYKVHVVRMCSMAVLCVLLCWLAQA